VSLREKEDPRRNAVVARTTGKTDLLSHEPGSLKKSLLGREAGKADQSSLLKMLIFRDLLGI